jgi:murein DD-endopeptidase MepM/ murein hydrolase activator NlpD
VCANRVFGVTALAFAVLVATVSALLVGSAPPAAAAPDDPWPFEWPIDAPVVDPFRPPATLYGAGNRGLEFATLAGQVVRSAGAGRVVFAGQVGGRLHVTVAHPDRLRLSYSGLASIEVGVGQSVGRGDTVGATGERLHVGARVGTAYVDPAIVFGGRRIVRLVPSGRVTPRLWFDF